MKWMDLHCHLPMLEAQISKILENCATNEVFALVTVGTDPDDWEVSLSHTGKSPSGVEVFATVGLHPHDARLWTSEVETHLVSLAKNPRVIALGEMGLDYYYNHSPKDQQIRVFHRQLEIAEELNLPVQIHTRDAEEDTFEILQAHPEVRGIIHCFSGSPRFGQKCLELGYNISLSGILTFKKATDLQEFATYAPIERLHVETDAPFLAPTPHRGKENSPAYVPYVAKKLAELKALEENTLSKQLIKNAVQVFPKLADHF